MLPEKLVPKAPPLTAPPSAAQHPSSGRTVAGAGVALKSALGWLRRTVKRTLLVLLAFALIGEGALVWWVASRESVRRTDGMPLYGSAVSIEGGVMYVQDTGKPEQGTMVFLPGEGAWSEVWKPAMARMREKGWRTIAIDLPPFGYSSRSPVHDYSRAAQARRVLRVLEKRNAREVVVVAHSTAARVAAEIAIERPEVVRGMVLVAPELGASLYSSYEVAPVPPTAVLFRYPLLRYLSTVTLLTNPFATEILLRREAFVESAISKEVVAVYQRPLSLENTSEDYSRWMLQYLEGRDRGKSLPRDAYTAITMPVALLWGDKDTRTPLWQAFELKKILPVSEVFVLTNVGHLPFIEDPQRFGEALEEAVQFVTAALPQP